MEGNGSGDRTIGQYLQRKKKKANIGHTRDKEGLKEAGKEQWRYEWEGWLLRGEMGWQSGQDRKDKARWKKL